MPFLRSVLRTRTEPHAELLAPQLANGPALSVGEALICRSDAADDAGFRTDRAPAAPPPRPRRVAAGAVFRAAAGREFLSHRLNRFLYAHVGLVIAAGFLPLLTPGDAFARGASWWLLHAVLYAISLSALLLGLSSAQAETDEFTWLLGQPAGITPWLVGKIAALAGLVASTSLLLIAPAAVGGGLTSGLLTVGAGAAGIGAVCATAGLAVGFWVRDSVRGLIVALALWFVLLFGTDLLLLGTAGEEWAQAHPDMWVLPLMTNPLDAFRVTVLFSVERAAFTGFATGRLTGWWINHATLWLTSLLTGWFAVLSFVSWLGARRRTD